MEKYIFSHDNAKIFYTYLSSTKKLPTLVFVHSIGANWTVWKTEINFFHRLGYPCLAFDLRAHGLSDVLPDDEQYNFPNFAKDITVILKKEKIKKFILIGHSFGGGIVINYCGTQKQRPEKLVLVETAHRYPFEYKREFNVNPLISMILRFLGEHQQFVNTNFPHLKELDFSEEFHKKRRTNLGIFLEALHITPLRSILKCIDSLQKYSFDHLQDTEKMLSTLKTPVLIISGGRDKVVPLHFQEELHRLIKKSQLKVINGAYHRVPIYNAEELCGEMLQFFEKR
jgi:pimeloyl-ACP methyl ester carboxylesterase